MASCENSWAGRVVIGLQLLSWCAVGALLLHRGISSVKQESNSPTFVPMPNYSSVQINLTEFVPTYNTRLVNSTSVINHKKKIAETSTVLKTHLHPKLKVSTNNIDQQENNSTILLDPADEKILVPFSESQGSMANENVTASSLRPTPFSKTTPRVTHNVRVSSDLRKNLILTPSGVVMAALGAIMLILGPSIVILRCCDAGSRGRFSKLYADDPALALSALDRPPTYEEVADDAPRYSVLFPDEVEIIRDTNATEETNAT